MASRATDAPRTDASLGMDLNCIELFAFEGKFKRSTEDGACRDALERLHEHFMIYADGLIQCAEDAKVLVHCLDTHGPAPRAAALERFQDIAVDGFKLIVVPALKDLRETANAARAAQAVQVRRAA